MSKNGTVIYDYVRVGGWDSGNLTIDGQKVFWPNPEGQRGASVVESVCSKPCPKGEVKVTDIERVKVHSHGRTTTSLSSLIM